MTSSLRFGLLLAALIFNGAMVEAAVPTPISKVPFTITKSGRYLLSKSLVYPGNGAAITVTADDVTIDLGGWTLESLSPGDGVQVSVTDQTAGIYAVDRKAVTIRNGTIRGFFRGIYLEGTNGRNHLVEDLHADACTFLGIQVKGTGSVVKSNRVTSIGGTTNYTAERIGIDVIGDDLVVENNIVSDVRVHSGNGTDRAYGIRVLSSDSGSVTGNHVTAPDGTQVFSSNATVGVLISNCSFIHVVANQISGYSEGVEINGGSANLYRDNTVTRAGANAYFVTPNSAAYAAGPNNFP